LLVGAAPGATQASLRFITDRDRFVTKVERFKPLCCRSDRIRVKVRVLTEDALPDSGGERLGGEEKVDEIQASDGPG